MSYRDASSSYFDDLTNGSASGSLEDDLEEHKTNQTADPKPKNSLRIFMFVVLVVVTLFGVLGIYGFGRSIERTEFDHGFESIAHRVQDGVQDRIKHKMEALVMVANQFTNHAEDESMHWPFVSLPHPSRQLGTYRKLAGLEAIFLMPLVSQVNRLTWEQYAYEYSGWLDSDGFERKEPGESLFIKDKKGRTTRPGPYAPQWQFSPAIPNRSFLNFDWRSWDGFEQELEFLTVGKKTLSHVWTFDPALNVPAVQESVPFKFMQQLFETQPMYIVGEPISFMSVPVFGSLDNADAEVVGVATAAITWRSLFGNLLQDSFRGVVCVVRNSFGQVFTLEVNGDVVEFLSFGDHHEQKYDDMENTRLLNVTLGRGEYLTYNISVFPSSTLEPLFLTAKPAIYGAVLFTVFAFASLIFVTYDCFVESRQRLVKQSADQARALVNSLFPEVVGNRLIEEQGLQRDNATGNQTSLFGVPQTGNAESGAPIAEFFVETTIMFADIKGFTAWASSREPAKVFVLLESIFGSFDKLAKKRRIFKVETVGDSYVAVSGLPEPRKDHAVAMARFAYDCLSTMKKLVVDLEKDLGPGTSDLEIRVGLNSGPVTAGVLRGEKTRFQLFGDTVNTAARMESTGEPSRIQLSETTAKLILDAGKVSWIKARQETVHAKGKGEMNTFWLDLSHRTSPDRSTSGGSSTDSLGLIEHTESIEEVNSPDLSPSVVRLLEWNVEVLKRALKKIVARRNALGLKRESVPRYVELEFADETEAFHKAIEVMEFASYDPMGFVPIEQVNGTTLHENVESQLFDYVASIARRYNDNPFHSFSHCSHVMLSVDKLMARIVHPGKEDTDKRSLHEKSYGLASDPLAQFTCLVAALVHDADHQGVSNDQLMKERPSLAKEYNYSSVAEKISFDLAWSLLMEERFADLRRAIYINEAEYRRFRQLMVNAVLATDVLDPTLKKLRSVRWENAFRDDRELTSTTDDLNRKATVVIQHLMEASDVAHCMQHWHVYRKWNLQLFREISKAYREGRCAKDPATFWYQGELAFFDKWVIPLARKLKQCQAFGVSSDEYLDYAMQNRTEWERRGMEAVEKMIAASEE